MEFSQLNTFVVVAKTLHFTRAAEVLNLTQPAVSQQIKLLEIELGHQLLTRGKGDIHLTDEGKVVLQYANKVLDCLDEMKVKINEIDSRRPLSIKAAAVTNSIRSNVFAFIQSAYRMKYKKFDLQFLNAKNSEEIVELLLNREIEIGFLRDGLHSSQIIQIPFASTELLYVVSVNHPLANKESVELNDLLEEEWILFGKGNGLRILVDNHFEKVKFHPKNLSETNDGLFLVEMIKNGGKISVLPAPNVRAPDLKALKINTQIFSVQINAAFLKSKENDFYYEFLETMHDSGLPGFTRLYQKQDDKILVANGTGKLS